MNTLRILLIVSVLLSGLGLVTTTLAAPISVEQSHLTLADSTPKADKTPKPEKTPDADDTANNQRVSEAITKYFGASASDVIALHDSGNGWGGIVKAYALAKASGIPVNEIFSMRAQEQGWGVIAKTLAVGKWNTNLGKMMRDAAAKKIVGDDAPGNSGEHRNDKNKGKPEDTGKSK